MIVVYTKENCPYCVKSKALLKGYGLEYTETMIGKDITREEFLGKFRKLEQYHRLLWTMN